jgi:ADP-ribose pyrophosphatase YjhB (NUDIX family)
MQNFLLGGAKMDIHMNHEKKHFKFRVCGILTHNGKYLLVKVQDNTFYCLPGGHAEIGEHTITATLREMREEIGFEVKIKGLTGIVQNFYEREDGSLIHEFSYYYVVEAVNEVDVNPEDYVVMECDKGIMKKLQFKWFSEDEIKKADCRPSFVSQLLQPGKLLHVVNKNGEVTSDEYECVD